MSDPFNDHTHGDFLPVRTVAEKYHDEIVHCAQVEIAKRDKRIAKLEAALQQIADAANYTAPEDIEARLHNEVKVYAIAKAALEEDKDE